MGKRKGKASAERATGAAKPFAERVEQETSMWKAEAEREKSQRRRVVRAYLALRDVKTAAPYPEPAIRRIVARLLDLPSHLANALEFEEAGVIEMTLKVEVWRIIEEFDARLAASERAALTPMNARYLVAEQELEYGDLETR